MRSFFGVLLIFFATLAYGSVFISDNASRQREMARLEALAITPPPGGGTATVEVDKANDIPVLSPSPVQVYEREPPLATVPPAPSPAPSKNEFRIEELEGRAGPSRSLASLLMGFIIAPAHAQPLIEHVIPASTSDPAAVKRDNEVELNFTTGDGRAWAAYVDKRDASVFLRSTERYIDERRARTKDRFRKQLHHVFEVAFNDREAAVDAFADWYFGFFTSAALTSRGIWGGVFEVPSLDIDQIKKGVTLAVKETMRKQYMALVMRPEIRDPLIQDGVRNAILDAHSDYIWMIEGLDGRLVDFLTQRARYVRPVADQQNIVLSLDWDSESWRAPLDYDNKAIMTGAGQVLSFAGFMLAGDVVLDTVLLVLGTAVGEAVLAAEAAAGGALIGTEFLPGLGTAAGAAAAVAVHGAVSYFRENMQRDEFVADTQASIDATINTWDNMIAPPADKLIDRWFNETKTLVKTPNIEAKLGS